MHVVTTVDELARLTAGRGRVGLVPTMGALHPGHAALLDTARASCDVLVASIFVNPLQFDRRDDLAAYPRTFDADTALCADRGVDVVFAPDASTVYPDGDPVVRLHPGRLGGDLEGAARPGHFEGMLTVVAKLFGLVRPDVAVFGEKDYQQLTIVRRMVTDLCLGVDVVGAATVREPDGLALSSRNVHLTPPDRRQALALSRALRAGQAAGPRGGDAVLGAAHAVLGEAGVTADYLELRSPDLGEPPVTGDARLLVAAVVGSTRLLDNVPVTLGETR